MQYRFDTGEIDSYEITLEGYLRAWAAIARIGVQTYYNADGTPRRELRLPEEVTDPESLASCAVKPFTIDHPELFLDNTNVRDYQVGSTGSTVRYKHGFVWVEIYVFDAEAIEEIISGRKQELSCGYECQLDFSPGIWRGKKYDAIQRKIRVNHVSAVERGRAGPSVRFYLVDAWSGRKIPKKTITAKLDDKYIESKFMDVDNEKKTDTNTVTTTDVQVVSKREDELNKQVKSLSAQVSDRDDTINKLRQDLALISDENQKLKTDHSATKTELENHKKTYNDTISSEVSARFDAWTQAKPFLPKSLAEKPDPSMSATDIKRAAVENSCAGVKLDGASIDRIDGAFEMLLAQGKTKKDPTQRLMQAVQNSYNAMGSTSYDARKKATEESKNAWMTTN